MIPEEILDIAEKIRRMEIRGARNIARAAARAMLILAEKSDARSLEDFLEDVDRAKRILLDTRPTAVSLPNALMFVTKGLNEAENLDEARNHVIRRAGEFIELTEIAIDRISEFGSRRIEDGDTIMTHCNSSAVVAILERAHREGKEFSVIATETRPRFQGYITARELAERGIDVTLIVDSAMRYFMKDVDKVLVGADAIAANGALVNKIGTSLMALAAKEARVIFMVAAETYKFHPGTVIGQLVPIEERDPSEIADPSELPGVRIRNPAFDVTPPEYIDLVITERGVIAPQAAYTILKEVFGWELSEIASEPRKSLFEEGEEWIESS